MDVLLAVARLFHYAAALQIFGVATFQSLLAPPALSLSLERPARTTAIISAGLLLLSGLVWLFATAGSMGDGWIDAANPSVISTVLTATGFGRVWGPHLLLAVVIMGTSLVGGRPAWWVLALLSTVALGSLGLVGHAATEGGLAGILNVISQVLHLLSSGFWLGALLPLLFCLSKLPEPDADRALRRFSGTGHVAVAILLLSGVANTWFVLGAAVPDFSVPYQQLLLAKIGIAGVMVVLAVVNRYVFVPNIPNGGPGARQLAHGTIAEMVLGTGILVLVSVIGMLPPH